MESKARVTIRDVASRASVSVATVSKVLNDRHGVAAGTHARVRAVIDELGYEASLVAQSLRNHRTNVIGILVADLEPFSAELLKGAADAIRDSGFELVDLLGGRPRGRSRGLGAALPEPAQRHADRRRGDRHPHRGRRLLRRTDRRRRPAHRLVEPAHDRVGQPARRPARHRAPARARPPPDRHADRPARPAVGAAARGGLPQGDGGRGRRARRAADPRSAPTTRRCRPRPRASCSTGDDPPTAVFAANDTSAIATIEVAARAGRGRARRPVGRRLRQHPRVGALRSAADHRRSSRSARWATTRSRC